MLMNFAEDPNNSPSDSQTPPETPAPEKPEDADKPSEPDAPAEPKKPEQPEDAPENPEVDPNKAKIEALQNSLDAALEELAKGDEPKPAEPKIDDSPKQPAEPDTPPKEEPKEEPKKEEPKADKAPKEEDLKGDAAWRQELENIKKSQEEFQSTTLKELEQMKLKDEMIGLTAEVQAAVTQYPNADADQVLLQIESGSDKTTVQIAKELHEAHETLVNKITKEQEEKIKAALQKENEGKVKVPQSSGTSSAPSDTPGQGPQRTKAQQDAAWAEATRAAKANIQ